MLNSWNKLGKIIADIHTLSEEDISVLNKIIETQIAADDAIEDVSKNDLHILGDYHLQVLRGLQQIRTAGEEFVKKASVTTLLNKVECYV